MQDIHLSIPHAQPFVKFFFEQPDAADIPDEIYEEVRRKWIGGEPG